MEPNPLPTLTCRHCGCTIFEKLQAGEFLLKPDWQSKGLPLPKRIVNEYSLGGGCAYRCLHCNTLADGPIKEELCDNYNVLRVKK